MPLQMDVLLHEVTQPQEDVHMTQTWQTWQSGAQMWCMNDNVVICGMDIDLLQWGYFHLVADGQQRWPYGKGSVIMLSNTQHSLEANTHRLWITSAYFSSLMHWLSPNYITATYISITDSFHWWHTFRAFLYTNTLHLTFHAIMDFSFCSSFYKN